MMRSKSEVGTLQELLVRSWWRADIELELLVILF